MTEQQDTTGTPTTGIKPSGVRASGIKVERRFTNLGEDPYSNIEWSRRDSKISNPDGSVVFEMKDAEIPAAWSQVAADIMVSKYFRKAGVPQTDDDGNPVTDFDGNPITGPERSAKDVINRLAETWAHWGEEYGYFETSDDVQAFEDELKYMLANQMAAPNSPQWFNTGLFHKYGITGSKQGFWFVDEENGELLPSPDAYSRPAPHACFIQAVNDDLVNEGGIMDLWVREARLFKMGSGTGSNFSNLRAEGEPLAGGGKSSGLMSFLKIGDRAAGAIKSGGTTRRAAKMVILDMDHPDIETFIEWKKIEEDKARLLIEHGGFPADFNGEAYATVSGQNSNNSVRVDNQFIQAVIEDGDWDLTNRTDGTVRKTLKARDLWRQVADAAWACADPGMQYHTTIQEWHTSPAGGEIRATNPCFTGDTLVHTDKGLVQFVELMDRVNAGEKFGVYTHDATNPEAPANRVELTSPEAFMITGVSDIVRLRFKNGMEVRCTPNHRFWTANRGWVRADELADDDHVQTLDVAAEAVAADWTIPISNDPDDYWTKGDHGHELFFPEIWTDDFAHYLGWLIGDGSTSGSTTASIYGSADDRTEILPHHQELLTAINGGRAPKASEQSNGTMQLRISRRAFKRYLEALGIKSVTGPHKTVPWAIEQAPTETVAMFLRGLFDADGCAVLNKDKGSYVGLGSTSNELLQGVQRLLTTFGITSRIYKTNSRRGNFKYTRIDGTEVVYDRRSTSYDLRVTGESLMRYAAEIGFTLSNKQAVLTDIATSWDKGPYKKAATTTLAERTDDGQDLTYNLTESRNHSYVVNGLVVSNCSEYVFLDDTACNLASINLVRFTDEKGTFDIEAYRHAIRIWTIVLEISVTMAHFPSKPIAQGSFDYRTLGLGFANLGSLLMRSGIAYDSDLGRAIAGSLTSILTGESYAASAEMAEVRGPFPRFEENRDSMLRVIRNHRRAAYNKADFEGVSTHIMGIDADLCPPDLLNAAQGAWDRALELGETHGYRNAQATVLAPTGTIGLLMDCDTTGVEPDFALVKFKKLAGGGYFKIANQSIAPALRHLDYSDEQVSDIIDYVIGTSSLNDAPYVNNETLAAKGFTAEDLAGLEEALPATFDLRFAFNVFSLGEETLGRLGFTEDHYTAFDFDLLSDLGFTSEEITAANTHICGRQTIEGAPHLLDEHLPVFDCANRNGKYGERFIHHTGHIKMMAAAQPFISGAISKTINMPNEVTVDEVAEAYMMSWELGIKAMALYRDGSKASQPLSASSDDGDSEELAEEVADALQAEAAMAWGQIPAGTSPTAAYTNMPRPRFLLPPRRSGWTQEARIGGHKVFLRAGEYDDGTLGEIFIDLAKEGATLRGVLASFAIAVSKGLQYGVPLEEFVDTFTFQTFEPRGMVEGHPNIKMATSIIDYVFRALGVEYLHRDELVQVPPDRSGSDLAEPPKGLAAEAGQQLELTEAAKEADIDAQTSAAAFADSGTSNGNGSSTVSPSPRAMTPIASPQGGGSEVAAGSIASPASEASVGGGGVAEKATTEGVSVMAAPERAMTELMGDAPVCSTCGHMTVRNGSCYVCLTCGDTIRQN